MIFTIRIDKSPVSDDRVMVSIDSEDEKHTLGYLAEFEEAVSLKVDEGNGTVVPVAWRIPPSPPPSFPSDPSPELSSSHLTAEEIIAALTGMTPVLVKDLDLSEEPPGD